MRAVDVSAATRDLLPPVCASCTWWQAAAAADPADDEQRRREWERTVDGEAGLFGRALLEGDEVLGWMQVGPGALVPRAAHLPAGAPSDDAALLTCAYFYDEEFLAGFQYLLQDVVAALKHRQVEALEAYALRSPRDDRRFAGYLRELNLFNGNVLEGSGFRRVRAGGLAGRYRLELRTLIAIPDRTRTAEQRQSAPATQPV